MTQFFHGRERGRKMGGANQGKVGRYGSSDSGGVRCFSGILIFQGMACA